MIVSRFVMTNSTPVQCLSRRLRVWITIEHVRVALFGVSPLLVHEGHARETKLKLCAKFIVRQIALNAVLFVSVCIENENRRRPECVEAMKVDRVFFDVSFERDEILVDELSSLIVVV